MKRLHIIYTLALAAVSFSLSAQTPFETAVSKILSNNPALAARRATVEAENLTLKADNNLSDPEVEFEHQWGAREVGNKWSVSVSQSFDWPGVYRSRAKVADARSQAFRLLYLAEESDMRLRVQSTLADYIAPCNQLALATEISDNLSLIADKIAVAFDHGEATILDRRKIEFERLDAATKTETAKSLVESLRYELLTLNGGKYINLDALTDFPKIALNSEDYYLDRHEASDPALLAETYLAEAARQSVSAASRSALPGFSLGYIHNVELGDHFNGLKVGLTLPVFSNRHRKAAAIEEARARAASADETALTVHNRVLADYAKARALATRLTEYDRLFPDGQTSDYLDLLRKSYEGGQMSLIVYLYEINYYTEARSRLIDLKLEQTTTLLSLSRFD